VIYGAADLHLTRFVWRSRKDLEGDSFRAFESFVDAVIQDKVPEGEEKAVLLAGDLFDAKKVDGATLETFCTLVDRLYDAGIAVFYIQGNHEDNKESPIAEACGAQHLRTEVIDGRKVVGIDYQPREQLLETIKDVECDVLVLHCAMSHLVGYEAAGDLSLEEIPHAVRHVLVGDIHVTHKNPLPGRGYCVSPGPLHPCNITQGGPKGFYKLPAGSDDWEFVEIPSRQIVREEINAAEQLTPLPEKLRVEKPGWPIPILELKYAADLEEEAQAFIKLHGNKTAIIFESAIPAPVELEIPELADNEEPLTLEGVLEYVISDPAALELAQALANRPDDAERIITNKLEELLNAEADQADAEQRMPAC
jgi:DNA repair exonuclease SbcCD nuclease subunit